MFSCQRVLCTKSPNVDVSNSELPWFPRVPSELFGETTLVPCNSLRFVRPVEICSEDRRLVHSDARCMGCTGLLTSCGNCIHQDIDVFYKFQLMKCEVAIYPWSLCCSYLCTWRSSHRTPPLRSVSSPQLGLNWLFQYRWLIILRTHGFRSSQVLFWAMILSFLPITEANVTLNYILFPNSVLYSSITKRTPPSFT